jgi:hypothetical protein
MVARRDEQEAADPGQETEDPDDGERSPTH